MRDDSPPVEPTERPQRFLLDERLTPEEIGRIETALLAELRRRPPAAAGSRRRTLLAVAAGLLLALVTVSYLIGTGIEPPPDPLPQAERRGMSLSIVRTDLPDATPYTLVVEFEPEPEPTNRTEPAEKR